MIRVGLIGAGFMGTMHSSVYSFLPNVKVAAVCDLDREKAEKIAQQQGAKVYTDPDALLADSSLKLDLVDICLPTFLHAEYACKAAASGLNVLCEKPFALDLQSVDKIISAVDEAKVKLMVGQCVRFWPEYQVLKQVATEGRFGEIQGAWFSRLSPLPTWGWKIGCWIRPDQEAPLLTCTFTIQILSCIYWASRKLSSAQPSRISTA